jgi:hypothetical protein
MDRDSLEREVGNFPKAVSCVQNGIRRCGARRPQELAFSGFPAV